MRLEANVSVGQSSDVRDQKLPNYKVEIKNVNSFKFVKKAIEFDVARQILILEAGGVPTQETRGFKESTGETVSQRSKEDAHDYRYFPDPDIPPIQLTKQQVEAWKSELPDLPAVIRNRLISAGIPSATAALLVSSTARMQKFTELAKDNEPIAVAKLVANTPEDKIAELKFEKKESITDEVKIKEIAEKVIAANPKVIADIKSGKQQAMFFLIGQVKKELGDIDIQVAQDIIKKLL